MYGPHYFHLFSTEADDLIAQIGTGTSVVRKETDFFSEPHLLLGTSHSVFFVEALDKDAAVNGARDSRGLGSACVAAKCF